MWNAFHQRLKVPSKPVAADPDHPADAPVGEPFGEQSVHQLHRFERNGWPGVVQGELSLTDSAQVTLFAGVSVAVFTRCGRLRSADSRDRSWFIEPLSFIRIHDHRRA